MPASINIKSNFGNTLDSRDEAIRLFHLLLPDQEEIVFDFADVAFMSRSFADQFHKESLNLTSDNNRKISITNAPVQVIDILEAVTKTQIKTKWASLNLPIYSFSKLDQLREYLQAI